MMFNLFFKGVLSFDKWNCEPPLPSYSPRNDADLIQVQIITRHGARTPLHISNTFNNIWECKNTELHSVGNNYSHPIHVNVEFGKSIFRGNCHFGQLLDKGANALQRLGSYIRNIYVRQLKFLPSDYNKNIIRFRTTDAHRTIHSQMSFIKGLYPNATNVVLEMADKNYDPWRRASLLCPKFNALSNSLIGGNEWNESQLDDVDLTEEMINSLGVKWSSTNDAATSSLCEGYQIPKNISIERIDEAIALKARQMQFLYSHDQIFPLFFTYSAAEMLNEMIKRVNGESKIKFIHWSAHDGNILAGLGFLGVLDGKWPPYGSFLTIELYKFRVGKQLFVVFRYNGKVLKVPRFSYSRIIPFDDFFKFVVNHMPDPSGECKFDVSKFISEDTTF